MQYRSLQVDNFKGFKPCLRGTKHLIEELNKLNIFIGRNNSGKTTLLDAINLLTGTDEILGKYKKELIKNINNEKTTFTVSIDLMKDDISDFIKGTSIEAHKNFLLSLQGELIIKCDIDNYYINTAKRFSIENHTYVSKQYSEYVQGRSWPQGTRFLPIDEIMRSDLFEKLLLWLFTNNTNLYMPSYRTIKPEGSSTNIDYIFINSNGDSVAGFIDSALRQENLTEYKAIIEDDALTELSRILEINLERIDTQATTQQGNVRCMLKEKGMRELPLEYYGHGVSQILLLVLLLNLKKYKKKTFHLLWDEPENSLHPGLQKKVIRYLLKECEANPYLQVFISTHSPSILTLNDHSSIYYICKGDSRSVKKIDSCNVCSYIDELGFSLSHIGLADIVIFVEGVTECHVVPKILMRFDDTAKAINEGRIIFHNLGGRGNFIHIKAEDLKKICMYPIVWVDSELKSATDNIQKEVSDLMEKCKALEIPFYLNKRFKSIENVFQKEAIAKYYGLPVKEFKDYGLFSDLDDYISELRVKGKSVKQVRDSSKKWRRGDDIISFMTDDYVKNIPEVVVLYNKINSLLHNK